MFADFEIVAVVESLAQMSQDDRQKLADLLVAKYPAVANNLEFSFYVANMEKFVEKEMV